MGAWGIGSFENDDACDWTDDWRETGLPLVVSTLRRINSAGDGYLEAPVCSEALAAAEVVATLLGRPPADLPTEIQQWAQAQSTAPGTDLVSAAVGAMERIRSRSELRELWEESGEGPEWFAALESLLRRLTTA